MRILALVILMMTLPGCWSGAERAVESQPLCDGTEQERSDHAAALARDGGPESRRTGRVLIARIDAGCGE